MDPALFEADQGACRVACQDAVGHHRWAAAANELVSVAGTVVAEACMVVVEEALVAVEVAVVVEADSEVARQLVVSEVAAGFEVVVQVDLSLPDQPAVAVAVAVVAAGPAFLQLLATGFVEPAFAVAIIPAVDLAVFVVAAAVEHLAALEAVVASP